MRADDGVRIRHMIDAAESALRFVQGRSRADLDSDEMLCFALTRAIWRTAQQAIPHLLGQLKAIQLPE